MINLPMELFFIIVGICLSAFFSGSEAALISLSVDRTKQLIEMGGARAEALKFLAKHPNEMLTTILLGNNLVNFSVASLVSLATQRFFSNDAMSIAVGISTFFILLFGEIIPKTFARTRAEKIALPSIRLLQICYYIGFPIVRGFMWLIKMILGEHATVRGHVVTQSDIEFLVNKAEEDQSIDSKQLDLLNSILEFPKIKAKDIMVPRSKVNGIDKRANFDTVIAMVKDVQHSRYPVYDNDIDHVIGFLHVKDLAFVTDEEKRSSFNVQKYLNEPVFIYEHMKIQAVFDFMNRKKVHMAFVKDENGLMVGIVTLEDIMEEIFGEIQDEHDDVEDLINPTDESIEDGLVVPGDFSLRDLYNEYDLEIPMSDHYSTLAGFLLDKLESDFPEEGTQITWEDYTFTILKVQENYLSQIRIKKESNFEEGDLNIPPLDLLSSGK
jgi:putative hemolysin